MEQYYYTDGKDRFGPFTIDQLSTKNIGLETLVWKEGMPDWVAAKNISDLQSLFTASENFAPLESYPDPPSQLELPPKNWLVESILVTIFCCLPFGIVGIINATKVDALWKAGDSEGALRCSKEAGKWVKIGAITGIIVIALYFIMAVMGVFGSMMFGSN